MSVYNFCAGPAMLPKEVMHLAQKELLNWQDFGCSVMEISHRDKSFVAMAEQAEQDLRELLSIPQDYAVLFMHGGGRGQFSSVPLNLLSQQNDKVNYIVNGSWSKSATAEANKYGDVNRVDITTNIDGLVSLLPEDTWKLNDNAVYTHFCPNETVDGIEMPVAPEGSKAPLVADMSSCILSKQINVSDYGLIYAGAQKNIGPSGLSIVIVKKDLLLAEANRKHAIPSILDYQLALDNGSMFNTPPTFAWYLAGLVFKWLKQRGGVAAMEQINKEKSDLLYGFIDQSAFYKNGVAPDFRSRMNVTFQLNDDALDSKFLTESAQQGLIALKGHRSVGGMRASIYNAMPIEGVKALVEFMKRFEQENS